MMLYSVLILENFYACTEHEKENFYACTEHEKRCQCARSPRMPFWRVLLQKIDVVMLVASESRNKALVTPFSQKCGSE